MVRRQGWIAAMSLALLLFVIARAPNAAAQGAAQASDTVRAVATEGHLFQPRQLEWDASFVRSLRVPSGFQINVFASGFGGGPRMMAIGPDGAVYVTRRDSADVVAFRDRDGDGRSDEMRKVATNLPGIHGVHLNNGRVYLATIKEVYVADLQADGTVSTPRMIVDDLPDGGQHPNRTLAIGPDGMLYVSIGSSCNACDDTNPEHATILRMSPDGSNRGVFARGLRNTIGWDWHPETGELWGADHGSDWRGDDIPPSEFNRVVNGVHYGWPFCYGDRVVDRHTVAAPPNGDREAFCRRTGGAVLTYTAHSAPIGMVFYDGGPMPSATSGFPAEYRGDAFIAMRGSWNRRPPSGYKVVRVRFENGQPREYQDFVTGFLTEDGTAHRGRLAGIAVARDGSLLVTDDTNSVIYRVSSGAAGPTR